MRKQKSEHIITISSVDELVGQPFNEFYCAAKSTVEDYIESLATYVSEFNIKFSIIESESITTEFFNSAVKTTTNQNGQLSFGKYQAIFKNYMASTQKRAAKSQTKVHQTGQEVTEVILEVVKTENSTLRKRTSQWAEELCLLKTSADPDDLKLQQKVKNGFLNT